ncbi:CHAD domain-containing protein [Psychromarinibacter sp. C21-152]|uniref:CHAD domain-containing protein n=1 Tax=Psychromarinibacter sediminicola TaxID=3033385 RepID=A0AAE3TAR9_9RHOB|nr:CHAD domain-containing protein [Psychromarinibacter sediminicola]MDF0603502.1 CHAD domain-containing protein [Psychromarinibacter sediminicola]
MSYTFASSDPSVEAGLRRIALDQLGRALSSMDSCDEDLHEAVHDARKRCKKLRGLVRLVRPAFPDYSAENAALRDAARRLSRFRDRTAMLETFDRLADALGARLDADATAPLREALEDRRARAAEDPELTETLAAFRQDLEDARDRAAKWSLDDDGFDAVAGGIAKTYKRARKAMRRAEQSGHAEDMHDWRKRVKYHWYHARLLSDIWPAMMDAHVDVADDLSDALGDHHDLAEFRVLLQDPSLPAAGRHALFEPARDEMDRLESHAFALGARLLAEKPKPLVKRWGKWWDIWQDA